MRAWSGVGARLPEVVDEQWRGGLLGMLQLARQHGASALAGRERVERRAPQRQRVQPHRAQPTHGRLAAAELRDDRLVRVRVRVRVGVRVRVRVTSR